MWGMGCCGGWGWWGMVMGLLFWGILLYGLFLLLRSASGSRRVPGWPEEDRERPDEEALRILKARYARGEITREEYLKMKQDLEENP